MVYACEEILIEILSRLPVKSLLRFMGVCRLWRSIITSPQFRLEFSKRRRTTKLLVHTDEECHALVEDDEDGNLVRFETTDFPFKHWLRKAIVVGSGNGLVCIGIQNPNKEFPSINVIWNPSIRKHAVIPMNPMGEPDVIFADGFGATIDYKYVRIVGFFVSSDEYDFSSRKAVEVYSWKTGTWRRIDLDFDKYRCRTFWPTCVSLRGRLHWRGSDIDPTSLCHVNSVFAFDLEDEVFEDIMLPECFSPNPALIANLFVIKESLALIANENRPGCIMNCTVWVMLKYGDVNSWTKLCRVDISAMINIHPAFQEFGGVHEADISMLLNSMVHLLKNGELLLGLEMMVGLEMVHPPKLVKYNPKTRKAAGMSFASSELRGFTNYYEESLVFLKDDHRVDADHEVLSGVRPSLRRVRHEALSGSGPSKRRVRRKLKHQ